MYFRLILFTALCFSALQAATYDCFTFYNELELLDVRLHELNDVVDYFVLVESSVTFRGLPKPYIFEENKDRYAPFLDKIIHVKIGDTGGGAWEREDAQRQAILQGLTKCTAKDIIILSDVDEIPPAEKITYLERIIKRDSKKAFAFLMLQYEFFLNRVSPGRDSPESHRRIIGSSILSFQEFNKTTPVGVRSRRVSDFPLVLAGWHFTSLGGFNRVVEKTNNYGFWNENPTWEDRRPYSPDDEERYWKRVQACHLVPIDQTYPKYILANLNYFKEIGFIDLAQ